jgi:hypothetical protein
MKTDLLLQDNKAAADSVINAANESYKNGLTLLRHLSGLGLEEVKEVKDWQEIENHFKAEYPQASLQFNLQAKNIEAPYMEAYNYYKANKGNISFEKLTEDATENIRNEYRVYATEKQTEAYNLAHSIAADLNKLKELGLPVNSFYAAELCPLMVNNAGSVEVYEKNLIEFVQSVK